MSLTLSTTWPIFEMWNGTPIGRCICRNFATSTSPTAPPRWRRGASGAGGTAGSSVLERSNLRPRRPTDQAAGRLRAPGSPAGEHSVVRRHHEVAERGVRHGHVVEAVEL